MRRVVQKQKNRTFDCRQIWTFVGVNDGGTENREEDGGIKMVQGEFTKEEGKEVKEALDEIMKAMPRSKCLDYIGHFNSVFLFLEAAIRNAPNEKKPE